MSIDQKLELNWFGKNHEDIIEPRILIENSKLSNCKLDEYTQNMLIHGDNLLSLKALTLKFTNKIKCIYIDPPYNTGSAFEYYDDNLEHSIWLSLMKPRLELLKLLLCDEGTIYIQIDDNEQAYLKVLCDEIFGRENFVSSICVKMSTVSGVKTTHRENTIIKEKEFILVYCKNTKFFKINPQYVLINSLDEEFQYYLEKNNSDNPDDWSVKKLSDIMKSLNIKNDFEDSKFLSFLDENKDKIWRRAFIRNEYKKVSQENPNKIFYVNSNNKEHYYYRGREMFFLADKYHNCLTEKGFVNGISNLLGDIWLDINTGKLFNEGGVEFRNSKKPEFLISRILQMSSNPGDYVLDSFLGSGTTCAVAQKMNRHWIGIELGNQAYLLCKPRLDMVINGEAGGVSKAFNWKGGGGYKFYELAPTLIKKDKFGQTIINPIYDSNMLAAAIANHEGFTYNPDKNFYWKQSNNGNKSFLFVTTNHVNKTIVNSIINDLQENEFLLIICKSFDSNALDGVKHITIKKIPQSILKDCKYNVDNYDLNIVNPPKYEEDMENE